MRITCDLCVQFKLSESIVVVVVVMTHKKIFINIVVLIVSVLFCYYYKMLLRNKVNMNSVKYTNCSVQQN